MIRASSPASVNSLAVVRALAMRPMPSAVVVSASRTTAAFGIVCLLAGWVTFVMV